MNMMIVLGSCALLMNIHVIMVCVFLESFYVMGTTTVLIILMSYIVEDALIMVLSSTWLLIICKFFSDMNVIAPERH
ncbi:hypothetical protein GV64_06250 [Endozoicomonas elysicola]|uniref:Uncharacterized protein n=1 Tax=Endozoicomonas elysicola TaxID=305900 RepID=A0A081K8A7_9GAMM|nr:hypothetical protein GV64_06250 [Endozoicomonas elysicola]